MLEVPKAVGATKATIQPDNTMDNQQERLSTCVDLGWLGGILDGEGNFSLHWMDKNNDRFVIYPRVQITNKDPKLIDEVVRILSDHKIAHYRDQNRDGVMHVMVNGMKRVKAFLDVIDPYVRTKKDRLLLVQCFVESRLANENQRAPYTREEVLCFRNLRQLNSWNRGSSKDRIDKRVAEILRDYTPSPGSGRVMI